MTDELNQKLELAVRFSQQNQLAEAEATYVDILSADPTHHQALLCLGLLYDSAGYIENAIEVLEKTVLLHPRSVEARYNLGLIFFKLKKYEQATQEIDAALTLEPTHCGALHTRGLIAYETKQYQDALRYLEALLTINDSDVHALNAVGLVLKEVNRCDEALAIFDKGLALFPANQMLLYNRSLVLFYLKRYGDSLANLDQILAVTEPTYIMALNGKASTLVRLGNKQEVIKCYKKIIALNEHHNTARSELLYNLLCVCQWDELNKYIDAVREAIPHFTLDEDDIMVPLIGHLVSEFTLIEQHDLSSRYAMRLSAQMQTLKNKLSFSFPKISKSHLRIGYISNDFRIHPLSQLIPEMLELHDRERFTIYAYSNGPDDKSAMRQRIEQAVDHFINIELLDPETVAQKIHADKIDILVDLTGFSWASPTNLLALRLAPVQVSYLGYLGTMAADYIDAIIADEFVIPHESQTYYTEKVYYLPCYQANDRKCAIGQKPSRASCNLPEDALVFCCFNSTYKITPTIFKVWCQLLQQVPDSVLWLQASNEWAVENLQREAQQFGIDAKRLIFADLIPLDQHLGRLQCADLFLDTYPYNAGTTASNALWVGLPIVTYAGDTFPSRMAGSLLSALQVPELITYHLDDYYQLALTLATDNQKLNTIKNKIKSNRDTTILFDTPFFTRSLESVYTQMWQDYVDKE